MAVNPGAIWRVRPSGNNANGGGYDPTIASPGTDYSQQNNPQVTFNGTTITASDAGTGSTITLTGYTVASTDVANALNITGGVNFTTGWYYIASVNTGANTWTLDRNCTSGAGSAMTGRMGGGWADFWTNTTSAGAHIVAGNTVYILGSGAPNPASYTYDYTNASYFTPVAGSQTAGLVRFIGDPATPSQGYPCIKVGGLFIYSSNTIFVSNIWFVASGATSNNYGILGALTSSWSVNNFFDQFGYDIGVTASTSTSLKIIGGEIFSSVAKRSTNTSYAAVLGGYGACVRGVNIHDCIGPGISVYQDGTVSGSIIAKCGDNGIVVNSSAYNDMQAVFNNTIDANLGSGIVFASQSALAITECFNNIISNHVTAATYGMTVSAGTTAANDLVKGFVDYNVYYNNTTDLNAISYGTHDTHGGSNPYVGQSTENYTLA